jgi:membrane protease YdiL (CAAX protease family)
MEETTAPNRTWLQILFVSATENRLRAGWRLLGQGLLLLFSVAVFGGLGSVLLGSLANISFASFLLFTTLIISLAVTLSIFIARRYLDRRSFTSLGLQANRHAINDVLFGFALTGLMIGLIYLVEWLFGWLEVESYAWQMENIPNMVFSILTILLLFALVSWYEELLSRGYWLQNLGEGLNRSLGVLLSSAIFALAHVLNPNLSWLAFLGLFLSGLFLAYGYLRTNQLWLPLGLHLGWNFFEGTVFGFPVSGQYYYQMIRQSTSGPELITGGAFGPEAGLILLPILLLGTAGIYWYTLNRESTKSENAGNIPPSMPAP